MPARFTKSVRLAVVALCALLAGCGHGVLAELVVDQIDVVDSPFPPGYPSSNPQKIATLHRGEPVRVRSQGYGKDYMYYTVELPSGEKGYIIYSGQWPFRQHNFP